MHVKGRVVDNTTVVDTSWAGEGSRKHTSAVSMQTVPWTCQKYAYRWGGRVKLGGVWLHARASLPRQPVAGDWLDMKLRG